MYINSNYNGNFPREKIEIKRKISIENDTNMNEREQARESEAKR